MLDILNMNKQELLTLKPEDIKRPLAKEELLHIAIELSSFWHYNYSLAKKNPGLHAELKSKRHSDGFFVSRRLLRRINMRNIIATQLVWRFLDLGIGLPDRIAGIPDGAAKLGQAVAKILGVPAVRMVKEQGKIRLAQKLPENCRLLLVEDFCTRGTAFKEAVKDILAKHSGTIILPYALVIINRGGLRTIKTGRFGPELIIVAAAHHRVKDWLPEKCPLCRKFGSKPIKPKSPITNWKKLLNSQKVH